MYLTVDALRQFWIEPVLGQRSEFVDPGIHRRCGGIVDAALVTENTGLHIFQIVGGTFLVVGHVALELELLRLQEVAGIILVGNGERHDVQFLQTFEGSALAAHRHHLQHGFLSTVVRVFGTALTLGNPYILVLAADGEVHIAAHQTAAFEHLSYPDRTPHDKGLIQPHQRFYPLCNEQIVADGNLYGSRKTVVYQKYVEKCRVEHNVPVIGHKSIVVGKARQGGP